MNALILDDEPRFREHLQHALERQGLRIHVAGTAEDAQTVVREQPIDLLIVDIKLPGADGLEFATWAKRHANEPAVIVMTGYGSLENERRSQDLGALAYLEKPFDISVLVRHVERAMGYQSLVRRVQRLERELAAPTRVDRGRQVLSALPVVWLGADGAVLWASPAGQAALDAVVDPALRTPVRSVDEDLLASLRDAMQGGECARTTLLRRDGVIGHFEILLRVFAFEERPGWIMMFHEPQETTPDRRDELRSAQ